jgi:hypothetical protein
MDEETRSAATRVFVRNGSGFDEVKLPELAEPKLPDQAPSSEKRSIMIKPGHWSKAGSLDLEYEIITESGWRGATKFAVQFDRQKPASIVKAEPETKSIVDYYLLLPKDTLEAPPQAWLAGHARAVDRRTVTSASMAMAGRRRLRSRCFVIAMAARCSRFAKANWKATIL